MTCDEFRERFDADRRANLMTFVEDDFQYGIAVGLNGPGIIVLFGGQEMLMAQARFMETFPED